MAMNKKEKAAMAALERNISLRWSDPTNEELMPDLPEPQYGGTTVLGWTVNYHKMRADGLCGAVHATTSESASHHSGHTPKAHGSQGPIAQHSTRLRALRALRRQVERQSAKQLALIDIEMRAELAKGTS